MMKLLLWFVYGLSHEIKQQQAEIAANARDIEGLVPVVQEAAKRTDDEYYRLRSSVGRGRRRIAKAEIALASDLDQGWKGELHHG